MTKKKKHTSQLTKWTVGGISALSVLLLWMSAASVFVRPSTLQIVSWLGLAFPVFLLFAVIVFLLCLFFFRRYCWISLVGILLCVGSVRTYIPVHLFADVPKGWSLKVVSYNVQGWGKSPEGFTADEKHNLIAQYLGQSDADIVCVQECLAGDNFYKSHIYPEMRHAHYFDSVHFDESAIGVFSHYPIVRKQMLCHRRTNGAAVFWTVLAPSDTLIVVNCHLASMSFSDIDRKVISKAAHQSPKTLTEEASANIFSKVERAGVLRADMADAVAEFLKANDGKNIVLCGDFNDSPISYARYRVAKYLTDAYANTGTGIGRTYNRDAIYVRIDHMFCSDQWTPYQCTVDTRLRVSDHYPIFAYFKRK